MRLLCVPGATGDYSTDLNAKAHAVITTLFPPLSFPATSTSHTAEAEAVATHCSETPTEDHGGDEFDFGFLHVKAVDDAGHDKNAALKVHFLQEIDAMLGTIRSNSRIRLCVACGE